MKFLYMLPEFKDSWILYLIIIIIPYILFLSLNKKRKGSVKFSAVSKFKHIKPGLKYKLRNIPVFLRVIAVILLVLAVARPRKGSEIKKQITRGVAIQMVIDKSGSMRQSMNFKNKQMTRLEVVKQVFHEFVTGKLSAGDKSRDNDLIGITSFSGFVEFNCPLTLEHGNFDRFLEGIKIYDAEKIFRTASASMSREEVLQFRRYADIRVIHNSGHRRPRERHGHRHRRHRQYREHHRRFSRRHGKRSDSRQLMGRDTC